MSEHMKNIHTTLVVNICLALTQVVGSGELSPYTAHPGTAAFNLADLKGQQHSLDDYRGQVVLINFWASWCLPCVMEMPGMQRLADTLKDQPFEILAVNISDTENQIREFIKRMDLRLTILMDDNGETFKAWQGKVLPASFLLDRTGRVRYQVIGPMEWDSGEVGKIIDELLQHP